MPCLDKEQSFNSFPFNEDHRPSHQSFNGRRRSRKEIRDNMQNGYPLHFYWLDQVHTNKYPTNKPN